jgi:hypothetical protein
MGVSRGKQFEDAIKKAFLKHPDISFDRFPDPMAGYAGIRNICDFGVYRLPYQYYFECKAFSGNTLNFTSAITKDQWDGLVEKSKIPGVVAGIIVWFIEHDTTTFVPIQELKRIRDAGAKSLNVKYLAIGNPLNDDQVLNIRVPGRKKRILFEYDAKTFLDNLDQWAGKKWGKEVAEAWRRYLNQH